MNNYYFILGVDNTASQDEIKRAYRKLSQKFHPDKNNGDPFFEKRFKEINEAYEILSDKDSRKKYDYQNQFNSSSSRKYKRPAPHIILFSSDKTVYEVGDEAVIEWNTEDAEHIEINLFGKVNSSGLKKIVFKNEKEKALIRLTVKSGEIVKSRDLIISIKEKLQTSSQNKPNVENIKTSKRFSFSTLMMLLIIVVTFSIIYFFETSIFNKTEEQVLNNEKIIVPAPDIPKIKNENSSTFFKDEKGKTEIKEENNLSNEHTAIKQKAKEDIKTLKLKNFNEETIRKTIDEIISDMVYIQGGSFSMGCTSEPCESDELPLHQVTISDFYISRFEVTQQQWLHITGKSVNDEKEYFYPEGYMRGVGDKYPMYYINRETVDNFLQILNRKSGKKFRLPTEAEWEYAAKGGSNREGTNFAGSTNLSDVGWHEGNSRSKTHIVGQKQPNSLGLYDMSGNVFELCEDRYNRKYYRSSPSKNPKGPKRGGFKVIRGGAANRSIDECKTFSRHLIEEEAAYNNVGFRLAY